MSFNLEYDSFENCNDCPLNRSCTTGMYSNECPFFKHRKKSFSILKKIFDFLKKI